MKTEQYEDPHLVCPAYPNCDEDINGCCVENDDDKVEWYGHRSAEDED